MNKIKLSTLSLPDDLKYLSVSQSATLCREIRGIIIRTVAKNGGHLASNLGAVELTLALHRAFESPRDKIIYDVSHQCYTHKILTGRMDKFGTLRKKGGLSGFSKPCESLHDYCVSGHAGTAVSQAVGAAEAMRINGDRNHYAVAVVGDGSLTGGMPYEALLNGGSQTSNNLIVVLNDNGMSISKSKGALSKYLTAIRGRTDYVELKQKMESALEAIPLIGMPVLKCLKFAKDTFKSLLFHKTIFESLGFVYLGPVDGHNIAELDQVLATAKRYKHPVFVHVVTKKGKGYKLAENNAGEYHSCGKFDINEPKNEADNSGSFSYVFGKELTEFAKKDAQIVAVTAAMKYGTGLQTFARAFPNRFFDVGIAEEHAVTFCASLAKMGKSPVFAVYSSFLQRCYDQILHDLAIEKLHVVFGVDRAGISGEDGETHNGIFDMPMLMTVPNITIYSPSNGSELIYSLKNALYYDKGIVAVRYPKGKSDIENKHADACAEVEGEYKFSIEGVSKTLIITYGRLYESAAKAARGLKVDILGLIKCYPVNEEVFGIIMKYDEVFFFEESYAVGGLGQYIGFELLRRGFGGKYSHKGLKGFIGHMSVAEAIEKCGLTEVQIKQNVLDSVDIFI